MVNISASNSKDQHTNKLRLAQLLWFSGIFIYLALYFAYLPNHYWQKYDLFSQPAWQTALAKLGLTPTLTTIYLFGMETIPVLASTIMAAIMFWRKPQDQVVLLTSFTLIAFSISASTQALLKPMDAHPIWAAFLDTASALGFSLALLTFCTFPNGKFIPRWTAIWMGLWAVWMLTGILFPPVSLFALRGDGNPAHTEKDFILFIIAQVVAYGVGVIAQIYRYKKVSTPLQRQQSKWILFGMILILVGYATSMALRSAIPTLNEPNLAGALFLVLGAPILYNIPRLLLPIFISIAVLRYRLFDIDTLINRSLVYGVLTITIGILYLTSMSLMQITFRSSTGQVSDPAIVLSTALIAIIFQPLRRYLQNVVDRRFYREKINFRQAFQVFTREVRHYIDLPELLRVIVRRITELFHSSYGALYLQQAPANFQLAESVYLPANVQGLYPNAKQLERLHKSEIIVDESKAFSILIPLIALWADRRELVGVLALGPKLSEADYGSEELSQLSMLVDEAGTAISLAQSIIEKRKAEREREIAQEATQAITANHEAVLNNIADGVLVLDLQGHFLSANPALLQMIPHEHLQEILAHPLEKTIKWKRKVFSVTAAPVPDVGTVAVFRDETRRNEMERAKDSMLATASHELRTPLTAVMNYLEMLIVFTRMGRVNTEAFADHLSRALENSQRLHRLVQAILDQAQIHAGRMILKKQRFKLQEPFERTHLLLGDLILQKGLSYELIIQNDVPEQIIGDADRLQQVLVNLIGNAVKFTAQGKVRVTVQRQDADMLTVTVEDTGPGIPPEQLPDIFEPFRRSSDYAHREHQGAGLGLSIVKEIVTRMGGQIGVSSEMGIGSVFTIIIPVVAG